MLPLAWLILSKTRQTLNRSAASSLLHSKQFRWNLDAVSLQGLALSQHEHQQRGDKHSPADADHSQEISFHVVRRAVVARAPAPRSLTPVRPDLCVLAHTSRFIAGERRRQFHVRSRTAARTCQCNVGSMLFKEMLILCRRSGQLQFHVVRRRMRKARMRLLGNHHESVLLEQCDVAFERDARRQRDPLKSETPRLRLGCVE